MSSNDPVKDMTVAEMYNLPDNEFMNIDPAMLKRQIKKEVMKELLAKNDYKHPTRDNTYA